ncbi:MYXO-CTERM sorting domain-containing protein, partial [Enhygromyxa salina]|uniref:MYXO-CTERM sorting domain-containing protein n=1 Tax=Enhygromyxa salina TaxID=215803 RepID=UPI0011B1DD45
GESGGDDNAEGETGGSGSPADTFDTFGGPVDDEGCSCSDTDKSGGFAGLALLALLGLATRRRRE